MTTIVLLSGGLDSSTVLAMCRRQGKTCHAVSFRYGQRHEVELEAAQKVAATLGASHTIVTIDTAGLAASALTGASPVPKGRSDEEMATGIPTTYVPARNTLFVAHALALAEAADADEIALGINALDYSGYPDCRPEWVRAMQTVAVVGTKRGVEGRPVKLYTPLVLVTKADIVRLAIANGLDPHITHSCYDPVDGVACGSCDSCLIRQRGFEEAGLKGETNG